MKYCFSKYYKIIVKYITHKRNLRINSDFLMRTGNDLLYYTRNLGTNYNNIICLNENGDRTQRKPNLTVNQLGVQFTIKVTEYACV